MDTIFSSGVAGNPGFSLPDRVRNTLAGLPFRGIHRWLFHVACTCVEHTALDDIRIIDLLYAATRGARRPVRRYEIAKAVADARRKCGGPANKPALSFTRRWPDPDPAAIAAISKTGLSLYDLWESSPCRFGDDLPHTEEVIDALFPGDPLLCCGLDSQQFATRRRSAWRGHLSRLSLIVPNPMLSRNALTQDRRLSEQTKAGTAGRVYLVIEFDRDELSLDIQAALHADLARRISLRWQPSSADMNLYTDGILPTGGPGDVREFMRTAVRLGADPATELAPNFAGCLTAAVMTAADKPFFTSTLQK